MRATGISARSHHGWTVCRYSIASAVAFIPGIKKMAVEIYKRGNYEYIMRVNDDGDHHHLSEAARWQQNEFVLLSDEKDELSIINVLGAVTSNEIKGIAGN